MPRIALKTIGSIPNHTLKKNLTLDDKFISNDGGDEGISIADNGDVTVGSLITNNISPAGTITIDAAGDVKLDAANDSIKFLTSGDLFAKFNSESTGSTTSLTIFEEGGGGSGSDDFCKILVAEHGATTISTIDDNDAVAHLTLNIDGDIDIQAEGGDITFKGASDAALATINGDGLTLNNIGTDTAGDNYLVEVSGLVKKRTPAETLADIGAQATVTAGTNCTFSGTTLNVDDAFLKNDADDAMAGNLTIVDTSGPQLTLQYDANNYMSIDVAANGVTTLTTIDQAIGFAGHLTLDVDGDIINDPFTGLNKFYINGGTDDYAYLSVALNGVTVLGTKDADGALAHLNIEADGHVEFDGCAVGFDKLAGVFSTSGVIGDGNDSTDIDFRLSNKYELELTNNISGSSEFINMIFPNTSGNFLLVIFQDSTGSRAVESAGWVVYQVDGSTKATNNAFSNGTDGEVRWAGGSAPTLTTTAYKADIISIYWDADNQTAFAVASLNF